MLNSLLLFSNLQLTATLDFKRQHFLTLGSPSSFLLATFLMFFCKKGDSEKLSAATACYNLPQLWHIATIN